MDVDQLRLFDIEAEPEASSPCVRDGHALNPSDQRIIAALERQSEYPSIFQLVVDADCWYRNGYESIRKLERLGLVELRPAGPWPKPISVRRKA